MTIFSRPITFDRFIRGSLAVLLVIVVFLLVNYLEGVLLPFALAWLFAYLLHPTVCFVQQRLHVGNRAIAIAITFVIVAAVIGGIVWFIIPPMIRQFQKLGELVEAYFYANTLGHDYPAMVREWLAENQEVLRNFFRNGEFTTTVRSLMPQVFGVLTHTANIIISVVGSFLTLIYLFFILLDYNRLSSGAIRLIPQKNRPFWQALFLDVECELNSYIRGQALVALCIGVLFCIGFTLIDFPMAIGLGILIGVMSLVPYVHGLAFIPMTLLSLLKAADTGENFWVIFLSATVVFIIIQLITDLLLVPKIMGKAMRLSPAVILLSLSVWGALLGFVGLIIALPLTTILLAYYKRYITKEEEKTTE